MLFRSQNLKHERNHNTPPSSLRETNETSELVKLDMIKCLGEDIGGHIISPVMIEDNGTIIVGLMDKVVVDCDVLGSRMEGCVLDELDS